LDAVDDDAGAGAAGQRRDGDLRRRGGARAQPQDVRRRPVAQEGRAPGGENGRHVVAEGRPAGVAERVHATMLAVQPPSGDPTRDPMLVDTGRMQLLRRDPAMLPGGHPGDLVG